MTIKTLHCPIEPQKLPTVKLVGVGYQKTWDILGGTGVILGGNSMFELFYQTTFVTIQ